MADKFCEFQKILFCLFYYFISLGERTSRIISPMSMQTTITTNSTVSEPNTQCIPIQSFKKNIETLSNSVPSKTFKILSISKKWESTDESDDDNMNNVENCTIVASNSLSIRCSQIKQINTTHLSSTENHPIY